MKDKTAYTTNGGRDKSMLPIFAAVSISFLLAIVVSIYSLTMLARENTKEIDTMLTYRIYDSISSSLNEPITVAKTMACDDFLSDFLKNEDGMERNEAITVMQRYLSSLKDGLGYDSAFLVSEQSRRYYTYEGFNKIVDPENDEHDIWYSLFVEKKKPYDLDVDSDEMNQGQWTVFVNARITDENGTLLGVCGVGVQMTNLQELFLTSEKEYCVKINLVDRNGLVQVDTEDINIENAWLDQDVLSSEETDEYIYQTTGNDEFAVTKYVEYLGWYLVVRSAPTSINRDYVNVILLNVALFLNIKEMPSLANGARWHHERFDGKGYPDRLSGEDIPEEARIIAVADAYDAMTSHRSYREPLPQGVVRDEIEKGKGTQFDSRFADIMRDMIDEDIDYTMREK